MNIFREKKTRIKILVLAIFIILYTLFSYFVYTGYVRQNTQEPLAQSDMQGTTEVLKKDDVLVQDFLSDGREMAGITLLTKSSELAEPKGKNAGEIEVFLLDFDSMEYLATGKAKMSTLANGQYSQICFDAPVKVEPQTKLRLAIFVNEASDLKHYRVYYGYPRSTESFIGEFNGARIDYNFAIALLGTHKDNVSKLYIGISIWFGIFLVVLFFMLFIFEIRGVHWIYLATAIGLGAIFLITIPEYETPDELTHSYTAYSISDHLLGNTWKEQIDMRRSDYNSPYLASHPDRVTYNAYLTQLMHPQQVDATLVQTINDPLPGWRYPYYLPGLGITIGRLLNMGSVRTYFFGSLLNYIFFVLLVFYAIRKMPFGKVMLLFIANLSITLQQATSYSYDCMVLALAFVVIALSFKLYYEKGTWKKKEMAALVIAVLLLAPLKSCAYVFVCAMALLPIWSLRKTKPRAFKAICMVFGVLVVLLGIAMLYKIATPSAGGTGGYVAWADEEGYTLSYLLKNPGKILSLTFNTVFHEFDKYLYQILGGQLGWLAINIPWFVIFPSGILLLGTAIKTEEDTLSIPVGIKVYMLLMSLACFGIVILGLLLTWTPISSGYVLGVQGRYFLPFLPMLMLLFFGDGLKIKAKYHRYFVYVLMMLEPLVIFTLISSFSS